MKYVHIIHNKLDFLFLDSNEDNISAAREWVGVFLHRVGSLEPSDLDPQFVSAVVVLKSFEYFVDLWFKGILRLRKKLSELEYLEI